MKSEHYAAIYSMYIAARFECLRYVPDWGQSCPLTTLFLLTI